MNLLIFGATGSVGRQVVEQALEQGYTVTAFARNPAKLDIQHPHLKVFQGDVLDFLAVERAEKTSSHLPNTHPETFATN